MRGGYRPINFTRARGQRWNYLKKMEGLVRQMIHLDAAQRPGIDEIIEKVNSVGEEFNIQG